MDDNVLRDCRELYDLMRRFWSSFGHQMSNVIVQTGVNVPQYMAMVALQKLGEATMSDLGRRLRVTMGASTNIVDKLVHGGYAVRNRGRDDRRVVRVKLLPKGHEALKQVEDKAIGFMAGVMAETAPERRRDFIERYTRMVNLAESQETTSALRGQSGG